MQHVQFSGFAHFYETGAHGIIVRTRSHPAQTIDPKLKHYSRLNFNLADLEAADVDPDGYPILMDMDGYLTEGTGYNVFMVTDGVIRTPTDKATLQGVSRGVVLELADLLGVEAVEEEPAALRPLYGGRGVLHRHVTMRAAGHEGRPQADRRRQARPSR